MKRIALFLSLFVLAFPLALRADTETTYDITFTGNGTIPASGSFTYDSTVPQFSNFIVDWDGYSFDMTASANNPYVYGGAPSCIGASTGAAAGLAVLTTCNVAGDATWEADQEFTSATFIFLANQSGCEAFGPCETIPGSVVIPQTFSQGGGGGNFSVTAVLPTAATPEPSSLMLLGTGVAGFTGAALRRLRR